MIATFSPSIVVITGCGRGLRSDARARVQDAELIKRRHRGRQGLGAAVLGVVVGIREEVEATVLDRLEVRRVRRERERSRAVVWRIGQDTRLEVGHREVGALDHLPDQAGVAGARDDRILVAEERAALDPIDLGSAAVEQVGRTLARGLDVPFARRGRP